MDYAQLQSDIADLLNRKDLTDQIPTFITLAEAQIARDIRHWRMENRATLSTIEQYPNLPADWVETIRLHNKDTGAPMEILSRQAMQEARMRLQGSGSTSGPLYYRHSQEGFEILPSPSLDAATTLELEYYAKVPILSDTDTANWLLDEAPDIYLYGSAIHSAPFLQDDDRIGTWGALYNQSAARVNAASKDAEMSASSPRMRKRGMRQSRQWDTRK